MNTLIRYLAAGVRYPQSRTLGFLRMGMGIEARAARFAEAWHDHEEQSRAAQRTWVERVPAPLRDDTFRSVMVVGAGRLRDFNGPELCRHARVIHFVDADPLSLRSWRAFRRRVSPLRVENHLCEVTGVLSSWRESLRRSCNVRSFDRLLDDLASGAITSDQAGENPFRDVCAAALPTAVLSLNSLSQIPVMWQDIVAGELGRRYGAGAVARREGDWLRAMEPSARAILRRHVADLFGTAASTVLFITDLEYLAFPDGLAQASDAARYAPPIEWDGEWRWRGSSAPEGWVESCERLDALHGLSLDDPAELGSDGAGWSRTLLAEWVWVICPKADDGRGRASLHRVAAIVFERPA